MEQKENRMGTQPVPRLLLGTAVPLMLSLLVNSLYNVVDSIFVSRVNEAALTALSLAAPVQTIMSALGCGVAVGLNAAISKAIGEHNREKVRETASAAMLLSIGAYLLIALACAPVFCVAGGRAAGNRRLWGGLSASLHAVLLWPNGAVGL